MTKPSVDAHVRLDTHPTHPSAVTATLTGTQAHIPHVGLEADGWHATADNFLVLARIDHEEPYWAEKAARRLAADGITVEITHQLRDAIDEEWTWANYPMPWCTRAEIREVSNRAQEIYDDIRHGRLLIHAHAQDAHTTVAVGTYLTGGTSVYLHGENHLRQIANVFDSPAQALTAFEDMHSDTMRPGPAPMTDTEHDTHDARTSPGTPATTPELPAPGTDTATADTVAGAHEALFASFIENNGEWENYRTWSDDASVANHETLTLRVQFDHEARGQDTAWTIASYQSPVGERTWHATATAGTPTDIIETLLKSLDTDTAWTERTSAPLTERTLTTVTRPLTEFGWTQTINGHHINWPAPNGETGLRLDVAAAVGATTARTEPAWTLWSGKSAEQPTWTIEFSRHTPAAVLQDLTYELAITHSAQTARRAPKAPRGHEAIRTATPATPTPLTSGSPARSR
ncbi:DUF317 domain-containing protein [Streptomyces niveus]|uniref:DUF317 domain-containing protein n=1 Tax=Streptomyces niveus TaxID=193462 RepID=UPI0003C578E1|nr:DUF317 domain-containing protein [Streptomyces niveus]EST31656.1 hypothetical protein M877_06670 [Streptomyces niveus NCIMB 11891]